MTDKRSSRANWMRKLFRSGKSNQEKLKTNNSDPQVHPSVAPLSTFTNPSKPNLGGSLDAHPRDAVASYSQQSTASLPPNDPPSAPETSAPGDSAAPAATATVNHAPPTQPDQLWDQAYDELKRENPKLFSYYETILSRELVDGSTDVEGNIIEQSDRAKRATQMDQLLKTGLDKTEKLANVGKNIGVAINIVLSVKDAVGSALQPVPVAALAWTGLCVALDVSNSCQTCRWIHSYL